MGLLTEIENVGKALVTLNEALVATNNGVGQLKSGSKSIIQLALEQAKDLRDTIIDSGKKAIETFDISWENSENIRDLQMKISSKYSDIEDAAKHILELNGIVLGNPGEITRRIAELTRVQGELELLKEKMDRELSSRASKSEKIVQDNSTEKLDAIFKLLSELAKSTINLEPKTLDDLARKLKPIFDAIDRRSL